MLRALDKCRLEARIGDAAHPDHAILVVLAAQVRDAVLVDVQVAQVAGNGGVAVIPADVGGGRAGIVAHCAEHQRAARAVKRVRHVDEVVLSAHAGHHAAVFQSVRDGGTERGDHHAGVEEAGVVALQAGERFMTALKFVDQADAAHADGTALVVRQVAQPLVERGRPQVERTMQVLAIALQTRQVAEIGRAVGDAPHQCFVIHHLAPDHAGLDQSLEALVDHLAAAVQADGERVEATAGEHGRMLLQRGIEGGQDAPVGGVVGVAQHQCVAQRIGERADADLQRAAISDQRTGIQADGVIDVGYRLARQPEQGRIRARWGDDDVEVGLVHRRGAADPGQVRIDLGHQQGARQAARHDGIDGILGQVVVARERQPRAARFARDLLHDHVERAVGECPGNVCVVEAGVQALRGGGAEQRSALHVELLHLHVRGQRVALHRLHVIQPREVLAEMPRGERLHESSLQSAATRRRIERQRGVERPRARRVRYAAPVKRIEQAVRLADAERCAHAQRPVGVGKDQVDGFVEIGQVAWGHVCSLAKPGDPPTNGGAGGLDTGFVYGRNQ